ncbi:MAG: protein kinase [Candidatus Aminicenantes bacterium]|nr:MAG: protein kinase [Candidatus Aminicenantes bacterium]
MMVNSEALPKIPGYRIEKKLGRGGMADVYLGVQEVLGRKVAIKVLAAEMLQNQQVVERFLNEARTASHLEHPNIVTIHDVGQVEDTCYIVMEYMPESLVDRIKTSPDNKIEPREAFRILKRMAKALDYAHREGFIHRDIKPDNILFRKDNTPVLVDFGIARTVKSNAQLTTTGMIIGTPHYMSPEQCQGEKIDGQSDIYSLGIVLYEMLTGDIPYRADSAAGILVKHIREPLPQLPAELQKYQPLLNRMVAKEKTQRIRSGEQLLELLRRCEPQSPLDTIEVSRPEKWVFQEQGENTDVEPTTLTPYKTVKKRKSLVWLLLIIFLIVGGGAAYYYLEYLPHLQKKQAVVDQNQLEEKEITVKEPDIVTREKPSQKTQSPKEVPPGPGDKGNTDEIKDREYKQHLTMAEVYFKEGEINKAQKKLDQAKAIKETSEVSALQKQINHYLQEEKQKEFNQYFSRAKDFYRQGNYTKAKENIAAAQQVKTTDELESLAREIRKKEEAIQRKAQQERLRKRRDDDAFGRAKSRNTIYAYEKYLEKYPSGRHAQEARKRLDELKSAVQLENKIQDDVAFEIASGKNTISAYQDYLNQFPYGLHAAEAKAKIEMLKKKVIRETKEKIELLHIKFFESGVKAQPVGERKYSTRFSKETTRYVYTEIKYKNKLYRISTSTNRVILEYSGTGGFGSHQLKGLINSLQEAADGLYSRGMGWPETGKWPAGIYTVTIYFEDKKVGHSRFEIY